MSDLGFGIVGTGFIAGILADAITRAPGAHLAAVSSRSLAKAQDFVEGRSGVAAVEGLETLLARADVAAVYVAIPTAAKEAVTLAAIAAGKHVLVDKPLPDAEAVRRMTQAAAEKGVLFMDATHFSHHPRTATIRAESAARIGRPRSLNTTFYFPFDDRENIRFDPAQEPMGAVGDMAWYSMRAVVEYLRPAGALTKVSVVPERDPATGAVIRLSGVLGFESGESATLDVGYTAGTAIMDLSLLGTAGMITMDDFVLDWHDSFPFDHPDTPVGFVHRSGMAHRSAFDFVETPSDLPQEVRMIRAFADAVASEAAEDWGAYSKASLETQTLLDAIWRACSA